jgi:hypothetical protein
VPDRRHFADLRIALEGERRSAAQAHAARRHTDALINRGLAAGIPYAKLARVALKMRLGRAPTAQERQREIDRLRQRRRRAMTACHGKLAARALNRHSGGVGSSEKEDPMSRLIRKTTTVEEFDADDGKPEAGCADEMEAAAEEEEEEDEEEEDEDEGDED